MAKEKNLTTVTSVAAADFARLVTSAGASVKATAANLAKYIIETYNGSTVAGSAQSVKSALDSLNSKTSFSIRSVSYTYSIPAGASTNTNLKDLIDADLPTGKICIGVVGFASNDVSVMVCNAYYGSSAYSLQMRNIGDSTRDSTVRIYYLCS